MAHAFDSAVIGAVFEPPGRRLAVALGGGAVALLDLSAPAPPLCVPVHDGAILHWCAGAGGMVTGGDDGRVARTAFDGATATLVSAAGRWVDALAFDGDSGAVAAGFGRSVRVIDHDGAELARLDGHPSTVAALAFLPGRRLAAAHYGGVTVHDLGGGPLRRFERRGSLIALAVSPDGRFVVAASQDREVVAFPLAGGEPAELSGFGAKPTALSWGPGGRLAIGGADGVIVWPFDGSGPLGRRPLELAPERKVLVSAVAFHPLKPRIAYGYRDGAAFVIGLTGAPEEVAAPDGEAVAALAWSADGGALAIAGDSGRLVVRRWPDRGLLARLGWR